MSEREAVEDRAAQFLMRRDEPEWSDGDQAALDAWLAESMAHKAAYWRLEHAWAVSGRIAAIPRPEAGTDGPARNMRWRWAMAASLAISLGLGTILYQQQRPDLREKVYRTEIGGHRIVPLSDGSRVELNTSTAVRTGGREVWLDRGEAYFEVTRDPSRPFVVHAGNRNITVLGTKFSVRRDGGKVIVTVLEGRVRVGRSDGDKRDVAPTIVRGDIAIAEGPSTLVLAKPSEAIVEGLSWREGRLNFHQTTLAEAAAEFNRYNRRKLVITDPVVAEMRIGGSFEASNVDIFVRLLQLGYGINFDVEGDEVRISG